MIKDEYGLTLKQKLFLDKYIEIRHIGKAYKYAYPHVTDGSAATRGSRELQKIQCKEYMNKFLKEGTSSTIATVDEIKSYLTNIMRNDTTGRQGGIKASELLAKAQGAFIERVVTDGQMSINVVVKGTDDE